MSATDTSSEEHTAELQSRPLLVCRRLLVLTAARLLAGLSDRSLKPKSLAANVYSVSSFVVTVLSAPLGASFTAATLTVILSLHDALPISLLAVPPSSWTWKVKLA